MTLTALGEASAPPPGTRLELAIARWDIQAHRTLAAQPSPPDLVRVARTQALIATTALIITAAADDQGKVDSGAVQRLTPALEAAQIAWTLTANLWSNVKSPTGRTDPNLIRAASDIRTAIAATAHTPTGWASPQQLAEQLDLANTVKVLQLGMVASVDVAHVMREVAAVGQGAMAVTGDVSPDFQAHSRTPAPADHLGMSLLTEATNARSGQSVLESLPEPRRRHELVNQVDRVIATAASAVAMTAPMAPSVPRRADTRSPKQQPQERDPSPVPRPTAQGR